jgi:hypothetical protein
MPISSSLLLLTALAVSGLAQDSIIGYPSDAAAAFGFRVSPVPCQGPNCGWGWAKVCYVDKKCKCDSYPCPPQCEWVCANGHGPATAFSGCSKQCRPGSCCHKTCVRIFRCKQIYAPRPRSSPILFENFPIVLFIPPAPSGPAT